jgi:hypothetical protein
MASARAGTRLLAGAAALFAVLTSACEESADTPDPTPTLAATRTATPEATATAPASPTSSPTPEATPAPPDFGLILADLQTRDSDDIYVSVSAGARLLRFSTDVINAGRGALALLGDADGTAEVTAATQIIETREYGKVERVVGVLANER